MSQLARMLLAELRRDADHLGYVDGSKRDYQQRVGTVDVHRLMIELMDSGDVKSGSTHITAADDGFSAKLTGMWPLHKEALKHLKSLGQAQGGFQVRYDDLAQQLGCRSGDAQEALLDLHDEGKLRVSSFGECAEVRLL